MGHDNQQGVIDILSENPAGLTEDVLKREMKEMNTAEHFTASTVLKAMIKNGKIVFENGVYRLSETSEVNHITTDSSRNTSARNNRITSGQIILNPDLSPSVTKDCNGVVEITKQNAVIIGNTIAAHDTYKYTVGSVDLVFDKLKPERPEDVTIAIIIARLMIINQIDGINIDTSFGTGGFYSLATSILEEHIESLIANNQPISNVKFRSIARRIAVDSNRNGLNLFSPITKYIARTAFYVYGHECGYPIYDSVLGDHLKYYISGIDTNKIKNGCDYESYCRIINEFLAGVNRNKTSKDKVTNLDFDKIVWFSYKKPNAKRKYN